MGAAPFWFSPTGTDIALRAGSFQFDGHDFVVGRGVFDPVRHLSGIAFAEQLGDLVAECVPDARSAVDLGTGSGLLAATLARLGLQVTATDVDRAAVACATQNCHGLTVDVRHGDMFSPIEGERFDILVVNPPYERGRSGWLRSSAITSADFLERLGSRAFEFGATVVVGFPIDAAHVLDVTGLDFTLWRAVPTRGRDLGLFVGRSGSTGS